MDDALQVFCIKRKTIGDSGRFVSWSVFGASAHEQETLGALGSNRKDFVAVVAVVAVNNNF